MLQNLFFIKKYKSIKISGSLQGKLMYLNINIRFRGKPHFYNNLKYLIKDTITNISFEGVAVTDKLDNF